MLKVPLPQQLPPGKNLSHKEGNELKAQKRLKEWQICDVCRCAQIIFLKGGEKSEVVRFGGLVPPKHRVFTPDQRRGFVLANLP